MGYNFPPMMKALEPFVLHYDVWLSPAFCQKEPLLVICQATVISICWQILLFQLPFCQKWESCAFSLLIFEHFLSH